MGDRSEEVGEQGQMFPVLRRIVGLCNEKTGIFGSLSPSFAVDSSIIRQPPRKLSENRSRSEGKLI